MKKLEHESTFKSLGSGIQMSIMNKFPNEADKLLLNPKIKIIIEV